VLVFSAAAAWARFVSPDRRHKVSSFSAERQQRERIDPRAEHTHAPVEVGPRDPARGTRETDDGPLLHDVAFSHSNLGKMQVNRIYTHSVVEKDSVAAEEKVLRKHDSTTIRSPNWRPRRSRKIGSGVRCSGRAIEDPAVTEITPATDAL
jgi:hypothetical protein